MAEQPQKKPIPRNRRKSDRKAGRYPGDLGRWLILSYLSRVGRASASEIARATGLARSSVYADLASLRQEAYIVKAGKHFLLLEPPPLTSLPPDPKIAAEIVARFFATQLNYHVHCLSRDLWVVSFDGGKATCEPGPTEYEVKKSHDEILSVMSGLLYKLLEAAAEKGRRTQWLREYETEALVFRPNP